MNTTTIYLAVLIAFATASVSSAQNTGPENAKPRSFSNIGVNIGNEYGIGLIVRAGSNRIYFEAGGGLLPLFAFWDVQGIGGASSETYFKLYFTGAFGGKVNIALTQPDKDRLGLKLGVTYNGLIKFGYGGGLDYRVSPDPDIMISGGFMYYPDAYDTLFDKLKSEENKDFIKDESSEVLVGFMPFVSVAIYLR
jgi:hypothetical protein